MIIKNLTKKTLLSDNAKLIDSFLDKGLGLLKKSNPKTLIFKTRFGIHTFFLRETIDIMVLDKNFQVKKIKENLKPNTTFFWNPKYFWIIELPQGTIKMSKTALDDTISIKAPVA